MSRGRSKHSLMLLDFSMFWMGIGSAQACVLEIVDIELLWLHRDKLSMVQEIGWIKVVPVRIWCLGFLAVRPEETETRHTLGHRPMAASADMDTRVNAVSTPDFANGNVFDQV